jgi:hypothetical protein
VRALLFAAFLLGGILQLPKVAYALDCTNYLMEAEYAIVNGGFDPTVWERMYSSSGRMIAIVRHFRQNGLGVFTEPWTRWVGDSLSRFSTSRNNSRLRW